MTPRLTVVVPVYNVEQYLEECLRSIAAQTFTDLDVVMVDDGSTDSGPELAQAFADRDPRFRLVAQPNGGLGHARNTGARNAAPQTSYLTFVDSDDVLPPRAYEKLVGLLDQSGSDFATGNVYRLTTQGRSQAWQHRGMDKTVRRTHITRDLGLLSDRVAWNKVFRRSFWDKHQLAFPEGVLYEDTPLTIPAHFLADAVDVLHEHVYYWRIREGSITRRRTDVKGVRDRIAAVDGVSRFLADPANTRWSKHKRDYDRSVLTDDLLYFIEALPMAGPEYHQVFLDRVRDYLGRVDPTLFPALPAELRIRWELIREGRLADLLEVLAHEQHGGRTVFDIAGPPLRKRAVVVRGDGSPVPLPRAVTAIGTKDLPVVARLSQLEWRDGKLILRGHAYVRNVDAGARRTSLKTAVLMSGRRKLLLPVRTVRVPEVTDGGPQERHSYDWSGFEITVDPKRLRGKEGWTAGQWRLGIVVAAGSVVRPAAPRADDAGAGSSPVPFPLDDDTRLVPWYKDGRLHLSVEPVTRRITGHRADGDGGVVFGIAVRDRKPPVALRATQQTTGAAFDYPLTADAESTGIDGWTRLTARLVLADLAGARPDVEGLPKEVAPETAAAWSFEAVFADGGTARIAADGPLPQGRYDLGGDALLAGARRELVVDATAAGNLLLRDRTPQPLATHVARATNGTLLVTGELPADTPPPARLVLRHGTYAAEVGVEVTLAAKGADSAAAEAAGAVGAAGAAAAAGDDAPVAAGTPAQAVAGTASAVEAEGAAGRGPAGPVRRFSAALDVSALPHAGRWYLHLRAADGGDAPVRIAREAFAELPLRLPAAPGARPVTVDRRFHDHLFVAAGSPVPAADRGPYRQRMLRERRYPVLLRRPLTDTVLYSSFDGRDCADSPRAVHDELVRRGVPFDHVWVVRDHTVAVPATARAVLRGSDDWYEALARGRHVVTNTHLPAWFRRREGQRVVQTWHGAPVKRIGQDLAGTLCADLTHMWPQPSLGHQWSVLLSPNSQSTPVLRRALDFDGEVAETGLPRTDLLSGEDRDKVREEVRARLGLPPGRTVVLYAPTVRDDEAYDAEHARLHLPLDLAAMAAELTTSHVLLVRSHPLVADTLPAVPGGFVRDVSAHPDLAELLLVADVLVTDYSSVLADFAVTGRPVLLFTPDLPHYRDTLRGFTFDYEAQAPGPLLRTTDELTAALRDPEAAVRGRADAYAAFRAAFCHLDDGGAAARVADLMLG
ncbi:CDP-glycerol glycerophosphotransferase family protein [Streptomyces sp. NPDC088197]|uniref:bifunctional glycosyltransferase/CDP-glycerol:glycerophosphate glycerophosphotransferase n=1 Tax=Streptomyces sp. NPDC088197 TaxID=3365840 RepID=UPI0038018775